MSQSTFTSAPQFSLLDPIFDLPEKDLQWLQNNWPGQFRNEILPELVKLEPIFVPLYSDKPNSRPSTPTYLVLGFTLLKARENLTDEQLIANVKYGIHYQYALGTTGMYSQPINQRTLNRFRAAIALHENKTGVNLMEEAFRALSKSLVSRFVGKDRMRRMDSIMIDNGARKLSRLQTAHTVIRAALDPMTDAGIEVADSLKHYGEDFDENKVTYHDQRPSAQKTSEAFKDAYDLLTAYPEQLKNTEEFELLARFVAEQIDLDENGNYIGVRDGKKLTSTTMNNPADPESTIRKKAGEVHQGYVGNFAETVDCETSRKIIDSADFQTNIYSDSQFAKDEIERMAAQGDTTPLATDGAYCTVENVNQAAEHGIELLGTDLAGRATADLMADFKIDEETNTVICPNGRKADRVSKAKSDGKRYVSFEKTECEKCPFRDNCPLKPKKNVRSGNVSPKQIQRAQLQRKIKSEEYQKVYRFRNGVEAIPSQLRRNQKIDNLPYKGLVRKKIGYFEALMAINLRRVETYVKEDAKKASESLTDLIFNLIFVKIADISQILFQTGNFRLKSVHD